MNEKGFTLIELLIVIAIIAIIAGMVFVALDPLKRFKDARDSRRWGDVTGILSALKINQVDLKGSYTPSVEALPANMAYVIGTGVVGCNVCGATPTQVGCVDLTGLVTGGYLASVPKDPKDGTAVKTNYYLKKNTNGTLIIGACNPETVGTAISVAR